MKLKIHSLSIRYILTFFFLVLLPLFLFLFITSISYSRYQSDLTKLQMQETVNQMAANLDNEIASVSILSSALIHNESFKKVCDSYDAASTSRDVYRQSEALDLELSNLFLYTNKVGILYVYTRNKPVFLFRNFPMMANLPNNPNLEKPFLKAVEDDPGFIHISDDFFSIYENESTELKNREPMLYLAVRPGASEYGLSIDKILFAYRIKIFNQIFSNASRHQFSFLSDSNGEILLKSPGNTLVEGILNQSRSAPPGESGWLILSSQIESTGWVLHHVIDIHAFLEPFYKIRRFSYLIFAGLFMFFIVYTVLFFQSMITPLNTLIEKMQLVEEGDYTVRVQEQGQPEMHHLFHSFNRMIGKVDELTQKQSKIDREKGLLELQALQFQINPHFIANTLNAIRLMAVVKKNENIKNMTSSLMQVINESFRGKGNKATLNEEKLSLTSYVHIMKVRFSIPIELRFSIPPPLETYRILKMLLQPIIENSIIHGFSQKTEKGVILVKAERIREKHLRILICDNGRGVEFNNTPFPVSPEGSKAGTLTSVGIKNVDRRIKLNYGEEYGLTMKSRIGFYTRTEIRLPYKEESLDDIHHDRG